MSAGPDRVVRTMSVGIGRRMLTRDVQPASAGLHRGPGPATVAGMAVLLRADEEVLLPDRCLVGRSRSCDLVLAGRDVSGEHAVLQWTGAHWQLRDLGSRNGTFVDEQRLAAGAQVRVDEGAALRFGKESSAWTLVDASGPRLMAVALAGGDRRVADGGYLALPGSESPTLAVYQDAAGRWLLEQAGATREVADRDVVDAGAGDLWRLHLPAACAGTWEEAEAPLVVGQLTLRFAVSRDEEHVALLATCGERRIDLQARAHHYVLLTLARRRLQDRRAPEPDQGWIRQDDLLAMLRISEDHLSISIHRARAQLAKAGIADAAALIQRRPGTRLLRLGVADIEVGEDGRGR